MSQETVIVRLPTARMRARKVSDARTRASRDKTVEVPSPGLISLAFYTACALGLALWDGASGLVSRAARKLAAIVKRP